MTKSIAYNRNILRFGIPVALWFALIFLIKSSALTGNAALNFGITADLLFTVPLVYLLLIYRSSIPNATVIPVMLVGLLIGTCFLPNESKSYLELFKTWLLPVIELSILSVVVFKVRRAIRTYKSLQGETPDFYETLKATCTSILPAGTVSLVATEIAVFYNGFRKF